MKTQIFRQIVLLLTFVYISLIAAGQASGDNNPGIGKFLGYNGAQDLDFKTNDILRMQLEQTGIGNINGFNIQRGGFPLPVRVCNACPQHFFSSE